MIIDISLCTDCNNCFLADKDEFVGNDFLPYTVGQPWSGHRWIDIERKERGQYPMVQVAYLPLLCLHCDDAPCIKASPPGAVYKRTDGLVIIDPNQARGHAEIVSTCPHGVIYWNEEAQVAQKCTGCAHLIDAGWQETRCSQVCAQGAIRLVMEEEAEFARRIVTEGLEVLDSPPLGGRPRVYYKNLYRWAKVFIGGTAVLADTDECAEGARALVSQEGGLVREATANEFGDFIVDALEPGKYELSLTFAGYHDYKAIVDAATSVSLGVLALEKA